ncbi:MAG: DUF433 domain-containing protein [Chloroflexi bacterium]|nr:DUF433 domain-containing protein [Chloroflexota bacterium]
MAESPYVEQQDGVYRVTGTRVTRDSLVYPFLEGRRLEEIAQSFPTLTLEQVYDALTYYLAPRPAVDDCVAEQQAAYEAVLPKLSVHEP